ncbi:MAG: metallophosphoesterase [Gemmatimonadetes bacterium]|nr:metallophosphoesterase [Gemmatimonadota bacterium]
MTYTVILIPDTQNYVGKQDRPSSGDPTYSQVTSWIKAERSARMVVAAIHLGDITNSNGNPAAVSQWALADAAHDTLDAIGLPYTVAPGNHDHGEIVKDIVLSRSTSQYAGTFGRGRFADRPWFLPTHPFDDLSNANSAIVFRAGGWKYLVVSLDFAPTKNAVCWANDLIAAMKDHRVIVATHSYLDMGTLQPGGTRTLRYANNARGYNIVGMDGEDLWSELVSLHSNVEVVASGHIRGGAMYAPRPTPLGNTVHQILVDYQDERRSSDGSKHGQGWLKMVEITPSTGVVSVYPVSATGATSFNAATQCATPADCYSAQSTDRDHTFSFTVPTTLLPDAHARADAFSDQTVNISSSRDQRRSSVSMSQAGDFLVVWEDDSDGPANIYNIMGRRFSSDGCGTPSQFRANPLATRQQLRPSVALDAVGNSVTVWEDDSRGSAGVYQVYARGLFHDGAERIPTFTVNQVATGNQRTPQVASAPDGAFAVAWRDERTAPGKVYVRGFDREGGSGFPEVRVDPASAVSERDPTIAMADDGSVVVAWAAEGKVRAAGYTSTGAARFAPIELHASSGGWRGRPAIAAIPSGGFVAVWEECPAATPYTAEATGCQGRPRRVITRAFDAAGAPTSGEVLASAADVRRPAYPRIGVASDRRRIVTWQDDSDGNGSFQVLRRDFAASGTALGGGPSTVNKNPRGDQTQPSIVVRTMTDGRTKWVISWTDNLDGNTSTQILARGGLFP